MTQRVTAAFLIVYLVWAAFGSVFAGEHVHLSATNSGFPETLVHHHNHQGHDHHHGLAHKHHDTSSPETDKPSDEVKPRSDQPKMDYAIVAPPHESDSLLAHLIQTVKNLRVDLLQAPVYTSALWEEDASLSAEPAVSRLWRLRDGTSGLVQSDDSGLDLQLPRPPPAV